MDDFSNLLNQILDFLQRGFSQVNGGPILGVIIAIVAVFLLQSWGRLWIMALGALLAFLVIGRWVLPFINNGGTLPKPLLPPDMMTGNYWVGLAAMYVGFFVVIGVLYFIKKHLFRNVAHAH